MANPKRLEAERNLGMTWSEVQDLKDLAETLRSHTSYILDDGTRAAMLRAADGLEARAQEAEAVRSIRLVPFVGTTPMEWGPGPFVRVVRELDGMLLRTARLDTARRWAEKHGYQILEGVD